MMRENSSPLRAGRRNAPPAAAFRRLEISRKHVVADGVPEDVVDLLETGRGRRTTPRVFPCILTATIERGDETLVERGSVRKIGQRIVQREVADTGLGLLAFAQVAQRNQNAPANRDAGSCGRETSHSIRLRVSTPFNMDLDRVPRRPRSSSCPSWKQLPKRLAAKFPSPSKPVSRSKLELASTIEIPLADRDRFPSSLSRQTVKPVRPPRPRGSDIRRSPQRTDEAHAENSDRRPREWAKASDAGGHGERIDGRAWDPAKIFKLHPSR